MSRRTAGVLLVAVLGIGLVAGCGSGNNTSAPVTATESVPLLAQPQAQAVRTDLPQHRGARLGRARPLCRRGKPLGRQGDGRTEQFAHDARKVAAADKIIRAALLRADKISRACLMPHQFVE
jgi:hypothetical protein